VIHKGLWDRIRDLEALCQVQQGCIELLTMRGDLANAHIENLIDRVADLEGTPRTPRAWEVSDDPGTHQAQG
jgi:hypothetical protein